MSACTYIPPPPLVYILQHKKRKETTNGGGDRRSTSLYWCEHGSATTTPFWCPLFSTPLEAVFELFSVRRRRRSLLALVIAPPIYDMSTSVVTNISQLLESLISRNDQACLICIPGFILHNLNLLDHSSSVQLPLTPSQITPFHSSRPPAISVRSYLEDRCSSPAQ